MVAKLDCQCQLSMLEINTVHFCNGIVNLVRKGYDRLGCDSLGLDRLGLHRLGYDR